MRRGTEGGGREGEHFQFYNIVPLYKIRLFSQAAFFFGLQQFDYVCLVLVFFVFICLRFTTLIRSVDYKENGLYT